MNIQIFQTIVYSALGYGGWIGLAIVPFAWSSASTAGRRLLVLFLTPPTFAFFMTAIVSLFYTISLFSYHVFGVMSNPVFVHSMCGSIAMIVTTLSATLVSLKIAEEYLGYPLLLDSKHVQEKKDAEETESDESEEETESDETEEETESDESEEETDGEETEGEDAEEILEEGDKEIDTTPLREAPPLPESDSDETDTKNA